MGQQQDNNYHKNIPGSRMPLTGAAVCCAVSKRYWVFVEGVYMESDRKLNRQTDNKNMYAWAQWATDLCAKYHRSRIMIRQLHYFALLQKDILKPDGNIYKNCGDDLFSLKTACRLARRMNLLPYDIFVSSFKNDSAERMMFAMPGSCENGFNSVLDNFLKSYTRSIIESILPVHIEVWLENSTAANLLLPAATKFNVKLLTYRTNMPLNTVWMLVREFSRLDRPILILHLSDLVKYKNGCMATVFDKLKSLICQYSLAEKIDIHYEHMMLTGSQLCQFNLPLPPDCTTCSSSTHIKIGELHALEAACPGYISRRLENRLREHLNPDDITKAKRIIDLTYKVACARLKRCIGKSTTTQCVINALRAEMRDHYPGDKITLQGN